MTQEDKELLLKDLCARLPYGVKCCIYNFGENTIRIKEDILWSVQGDNILTLKSCVEKGEAYMYHQIKPYLFPLSSLTEEQRNDISKLLIETQNTFSPYGEINTKGCDNLFICSVKQSNALINYCLMHHLDVNGLIEKGLAIDATGLNIY